MSILIFRCPDCMVLFFLEIFLRTGFHSNSIYACRKYNGRMRQKEILSTGLIMEEKVCMLLVFVMNSSMDEQCWLKGMASYSTYCVFY